MNTEGSGRELRVKSHNDINLFPPVNIQEDLQKGIVEQVKIYTI